MQLTNRELWTLIHGMGLGALFLLAFAGGLAGFYSLRPEWLTTAGLRERIVRLDIGTVVMAIVAWLTVITGTWIVYPWYRARPPEGATELEAYPRYFLLANEHLAGVAPLRDGVEGARRLDRAVLGDGRGLRGGLLRKAAGLRAGGAPAADLGVCGRRSSSPVSPASSGRSSPRLPRSSRGHRLRKRGTDHGCEHRSESTSR